MSNLSQLPQDVLGVISKRLKKFEDFVSFSWVSKSLLAAVMDEYFQGLRIRQGMPYLMLPVRDRDDVRELYSLVEGESIVASLKDPNLGKTNKCFESLGWLLVVSEDGNMSLFNPFSDTAEISLPHQRTFPTYAEGGMDAQIFIQKMVLSARPSDTSNFLVIVIGGSQAHMAFWRLGDKAWNKIENPCRVMYMDVMYHNNGQFYAIGINRRVNDPDFFHGYYGLVQVFNFDGNSDHVENRLILKTHLIVPNFASMNPVPAPAPMNLYILKTDDSLLVITRKSPNLSEDGCHYMTSEFKVYQVDETNTDTWKEIYSLGSMAILPATVPPWLLMPPVQVQEE